MVDRVHQEQSPLDPRTEVEVKVQDGVAYLSISDVVALLNETARWCADEPATVELLDALAEDWSAAGHEAVHQVEGGPRG